MFDGSQYGNFSSRISRRDSCEALNKGSFPYIILEFAEHKELYDYLEVCGAFSEEIARYYFLQLLDAIEYLHNQKITHRDIKLQNILLGKDYEIKLADLGLASTEDDEQLKDIRGTLCYMAPEVLNNTDTGNLFLKSCKSDIYSAGVVLFNMMTGNMPYSMASSNDRKYTYFFKNKKKFWQIHRKTQYGYELNKDFEELID